MESDKPNKSQNKRTPFVAATLSLLLPGAGQFYNGQLIKGVIIPERVDGSTHVFHQYTIQVPADKRDDLKEYLGELNIPSMIYYPVPLQNQEAFKGLSRIPGSLETDQYLTTVVLSLPMHSELDEEQLNFICSAIRSYLA